MTKEQEVLMLFDKYFKQLQEEENWVTLGMFSKLYSELKEVLGIKNADKLESI